MLRHFGTPRVPVPIPKEQRLQRSKHLHPQRSQRIPQNDLRSRQGIPRLRRE